MDTFKKYAAPLGVFALLIAGAAGLTFVHQTQAQSSTNTKTMMGRLIGRGVSGTAVSVNGNTITITGKNGTTYTVDAANAVITKIANGAKTTITASQIATGDTLRVMGTVSGTSVTAKTVLDGIMPARQAPSATGTVSAISGNTITLTSGSTTYTVDASNASITISKPAGTGLANSGIMTGDSITVSGTTTGTNIVATRISDGKPGMYKGFGIMPMTSK